MVCFWCVFSFFFFNFGHMKRLENYLDNTIAQHSPFPELWSAQHTGLCWEFHPSHLSPAYDL